MIKERQIAMTDKTLVSLYIYFSVLFIGGTIWLVCTLVGSGGDYSFLNKFKAASLASLTGLSVFFIRKIYKDSYKKDKYVDGTFREKLATVMYFLARPLYEVFFSLLLILSLNLGYAFLIPVDIPRPINNYIEFIALISLLMGLVIGKIIDKVERKVGEAIDNG